MNDKGFTLIETVLVIAIIGILSSILLPKFKTYQLKANVVSHNASVEVLKSAALLYHLDNPDIDNIGASENFKDYIEKDDLKVNPYILKNIKANQEFEIKVKENQIYIEPGELLINDGKIEKKAAYETIN